MGGVANGDIDTIAGAACVPGGGDSTVVRCRKPPSILSVVKLVDDAGAV